METLPTHPWVGTNQPVPPPRVKAEGAVEIKAPETKPWGQVVPYVRCPDGTLVEIRSPIGG